LSNPIRPPGREVRPQVYLIEVDVFDSRLKVSESLQVDRLVMPVVFGETLRLTEQPRFSRHQASTHSYDLFVEDGVEATRIVKVDWDESLNLSERLDYESHLHFQVLLTLSEYLEESAPGDPAETPRLHVVDSIESTTTQRPDIPVESLRVGETVELTTFGCEAISPTTLSLTLPFDCTFGGLSDASNYVIVSEGKGYPIDVLSAAPIVDELRDGKLCQVAGVHEIVLDKNFSAPDLGSFLHLEVKGSGTTRVRIEEVVSPTRVRVDRSLSPSDEISSWRQTTGVSKVVLTTSKGTNGALYRLTCKRIRNTRTLRIHQDFSTCFVAKAAKPRLVNVECLPEGQILLTYSEPMRPDSELTSVSEYRVEGPTPVEVMSVDSVGPTQVMLRTRGLTKGSFKIIVNTKGTPKDVAGNPITEVIDSGIGTANVLTSTTVQIPSESFVASAVVGRYLTLSGTNSNQYLIVDRPTADTLQVEGTLNIEIGLDWQVTNPFFNEAIFISSTPLTQRSIFTDRGPISKPPLTLSSGVDGTVINPTDVICSSANFSSDVVGKYLNLAGESYRIVALLTSTSLRVQGSLQTATNLNWSVIDPRNGQIADDPSDVTVRVNGVPVEPVAVIGLMGQIVLAAAPEEDDDVKVDYHWVSNPTIDIRRLNSREFVLNNWNRDNRQIPNPNQHNYRYNNVLVKPSGYVADDCQSVLAQPLERQLFYRAFERKYTAVLNDPNLLRLNSPIHRIADAPLSRPIETISVQYNADTLPESSFPAWTRVGNGTYSVTSGTLSVNDTSSGNFPTGLPLFWTRSIDVTYPHVFAATWRMSLTDTPVLNGVFSGVAAGWSDDEKAVVVGYLKDGSTYKIGFLRQGYGDNPAPMAAWTGAINESNEPTGLPQDFDVTIPHSYRLFQDRDGIVKLFVDGGVIEILRITKDELPFLYELNDPFDQIQGAYFGSLSREATSSSDWDFYRYLILPTNPIQSAPAVFVSYEGNTLPERDFNPWTPVGYHGTETISGGDVLVLDSTSATDAMTSALVGLVDGDFRGLVRFEPLLTAAADAAVDWKMQLRTWTQGIAPNAMTLAMDDGKKLIQVSMLAKNPSPKFSYGGRVLPENATPVGWERNTITTLPGITTSMLGRALHIEDTIVSDGVVYHVNDFEAGVTPDRVIETTLDYILEFRVKVNSFTATDTGLNGSCFAGVTADIFDGVKTLGLLFREDPLLGTTLAFHSDGVILGMPSNPVQFQFAWDDGLFHTYRLVKNTLGDLVTLFVDTLFIGSVAYSAFVTSAGNPTVSFGTATPDGSSLGALSDTEWAYVNAWRVADVSVQKYLGVWRGHDPDSLLGYHLPTKLRDRTGMVLDSTTLTDAGGSFVINDVDAGDVIIVDGGVNRGVYDVAARVNATTLTLTTPFPVPAVPVLYRVPREVDWTQFHNYRLVRDRSGNIKLSVDSQVLIDLEYDSDLPSNSVGLWRQLTNGVPSIVFGAFDPTNLSQSGWDFVRYGITRSLSEQRIVPHHMVLNQRNIMASPDHLFTSVAHRHTNFWSSSTGIPLKELYDDANHKAFTKLNEGTPLVPQTQTSEVRKPTPIFESLSGLNRPEDVLNSDSDFVLNDAKTRVRLLVPNDVLYNSLEVTERSEGETDLLYPMDDSLGPVGLGSISFKKDVCLHYDGATFPELDSNAPTPWSLNSVSPSDVQVTSFGGVLTYSTTGSTTTIYRNPTSLPSATSLPTEVKFTFKVLTDSSGGTGDTGVRVGFSAFGMTAALAFLTDPYGDRVVRLLDMQSGDTLAEVLFDFLDNLPHQYRLVRDPTAGTVSFFVDG